MNKTIQRNIDAHNKGSATYERRHGEIFNAIEQERLYRQLAEIVSALGNHEAPSALDFGCGSGNLTAHLLSLGCFVTAADVSDKFLHLVEKRFAATGRCATMKLDGRRGELPLNTYDLVCTYSVLHHVPDYLETIRELVRSLRPGGYVFIDHEPSPSAWLPNPAIDSWHREGRQVFPWVMNWLRSVLTWEWMKYRFRRLRDSRASLEGDIHVWPDDHVDWDSVELAVREEGAEPWRVVDYLLYRRDYSASVYERYRPHAADTRCFVARKHPARI